jgi:hypothetical protein
MLVGLCRADAGEWENEHTDEYEDAASGNDAIAATNA